MTRIILTFIASAMLWVNIGNAQDTPVVEESEAFLEAVWPKSCTIGNATPLP